MTDEAKALVEQLGEEIIADAFQDGRLVDGRLAERLIRERLNARDLIETQAREIERLRYGIAKAALWTAEPGITLAEIRAALGESHDQ